MAYVLTLEPLDYKLEESRLHYELEPADDYSTEEENLDYEVSDS